MINYVVCAFFIRRLIHDCPTPYNLLCNFFIFNTKRWLYWNAWPWLSRFRNRLHRYPVKSNLCFVVFKPLSLLMKAWSIFNRDKSKSIKVSNSQIYLKNVTFRFESDSDIRSRLNHTRIFHYLFVYLVHIPE